MLAIMDRRGARKSLHRLTGRRHDPRDDYRRRRVCNEAARIMADEGVRDFHTAKLKACERLGVRTPGVPLPTNGEVEQELGLRLRLFEGARHELDAQHLRHLARAVMSWLAVFEPRAVGAMVRGNVTAYSPIELHVFSDTPEAVMSHLEAEEVPFELFERRLRYGHDRYEIVPGLLCTYGETPVELTMFPPMGLREPPLCPVFGRPMRRLRADELERLTVAYAVES
jgi:hypothetical protein